MLKHNHSFNKHLLGPLVGIRYIQMKSMEGAPSIVEGQKCKETGEYRVVSAPWEPGGFGKEAWGCKIMNELPRRSGGRA